jgi:hypothetical protein
MAIDLDEKKVRRNAFSLWLAWTLATAFGMLLGYLPFTLIIQDVELGIARVIIPILAGALIGLAQWIVLRGYVTRSYDWILNLAGGWVLGYTIGLFVVDLLSGVQISTLVGYILFGIIVAVFQWPVLRREIPQIWPWILANVTGWTLGAFISQVLVGSLDQVSGASLIANTLATVGITGLVAGAITALALIWIVRKPERTVY